MPVKHSTTAASGDLITSTKWNADHDVSGKPSLQTITWVAEPGGFDITCTTAGTWYPSNDAGNPMRFYIPGARFLSIDRATTSIRWKATAASNPNCNLRIVTVSGKTNSIGTAYQPFTSGDLNTTLDSDLFITFPSGNTEYLIQVRSDVNSTTVTLYNVISYLWAN